MHYKQGSLNHTTRFYEKKGYTAILNCSEKNENKVTQWFGTPKNVYCKSQGSTTLIRYGFLLI